MNHLRKKPIQAAAGSLEANYSTNVFEKAASSWLGKTRKITPIQIKSLSRLNAYPD
jgi:hypothetical protein